MIDADKKYCDYVKNCKKKPKNFCDWLILMSKIQFHYLYIRPIIVWCQETRQELNLNHKI
jgi:hypothetical protein